MIRVLHLINSLDVGGGERFLVDLLARLDAAHFQVNVLCLYREGSWANRVRSEGVHVQSLGIGRKIKLRCWIEVWREVRRIRPDIVHTHLPEACWYGLPAAWAARVPVRIAHLQNCYSRWSPKLRLMDHVAARFATKAIACSEAVRQFYVTRVRYSPRKIEVIPNSADLAPFRDLPPKDTARRRLQLTDDALVASCVAALVPQKGHADLLEAMVAVRAAFPRVRLLLVGDGPLRSRLEARSRELGLGSAVQFLGQRSDVPGILGASDLVVLPSHWEGLPLALVEAAAAGLPAVATRVDGTPEVLQEGQTGLLVEPGDQEGLASALCTLLGDSDFRSRLGARARAEAFRRFDVGAAAMKVEALYREQIARSR